MIHPSVETERLLLRPWRPAEDLDALAAVNADPAVMRWVTPNRPLRREETADFLDRVIRHWDDHGFGLWALVPRREADAGCIGFAGLAIPSFLPAVLPAVEVGWRLGSAWWARGLAPEAARATIVFGFARLGLRVDRLDRRRAQRALAARGGEARHAPRPGPAASGDAPAPARDASG